MADTINPADLNKLALKFTQMPEGDAKNAFFHSHLELHTIFRGIHFPKPEPTVAAAKTETTTT